ncbi:hypothetical protein V6N12_035728 [Hibiscus sabdariffa]|uniref:Reverse transcriptase zinc-binding domain-containing protein n=1 Tax=Hibiscus sabdariffa TaxID=183260 RepID=A0ABR2ER07_9ROSI
MENKWDPKLPIWDLVWSLPIPQCIQEFIWLVTWQHIMKDLDEALLPAILVLRDCATVRELWQQLLPPSVRSKLFLLDLVEWISFNLSADSHSSCPSILIPMDFLIPHGFINY